MSEQQWPMVEWKGDNQPEVEALLAQHVVRTDRAGKVLTIILLGGGEIKVTPGDWLMLDGDQLGVLRAEPGEWLAPATH